MMRALVVGLILLLTASHAHAQPAHLAADAARITEAEPPYVDVLTFGVGARIFEKFGHAALCLRYHQPEHATTCFNYGVTDFAGGGGMVWRFLRSEQKFWVEPTSWDSMFAFYRYEDRDIWIQTLPLTAQQARALEDKLWSDLREENRYYYYNHFLDNCTTRLRDMIDTATGGALRPGTEASYPLTFRDLGRRGLATMPPLLVASDFVTGRMLDQHPTVWQAMFHPEVFRQQIEVAFGVKPRLIYARRGAAFPSDGSSGRLPTLGFALLFALPLLLARVRRVVVHAAFWPVLGYVLYTIAPVFGAVATAIAAILFAAPFLVAHRSHRFAVAWATVLLAIGGLLVWGLAVLSSIDGIRWNEVLLVLVPLDLALPIVSPARRRAYARGRVIGLLGVSALTAIGLLHQPLWIPVLVALLPLAAIASEPQPVVVPAAQPMLAPAVTAP